jgi:hypothetical protein
VPKVLFKSVTDDDHLDQTPKMRLVDAVDARANNRGDLVFELSSRHDREFVIYRVSSGRQSRFSPPVRCRIPGSDVCVDQSFRMRDSRSQHFG